MSRLGNYALLVVSLLFVAAGIGMVATGADGGWPALLFFGACAGIAVWQLWPELVEGSFAEPTALLGRFPGPVELRTPWRKTVFLAAFTLAFGSGCLWVVLTEPVRWWAAAFLWLGVIFFAVGIPVLLLVLAKGSTLKLAADGFTVAHAWRRRFVTWTDTGEFEVAQVPPSFTPLVVFDDVTAGSGTVASANVALVGRNSALPDSYGLSHHDLAALLNAWRDKALGR